MFRRTSCVIIFLLMMGGSTFAQGTVDKYGNYHPTEEEIAKNKRVGELMQHPTFISLRLASQGRDVPREGPSTTPSPYAVDQRVHFELFLTQNSAEDIMLQSSGWPYSEYRPELIRDGDIVPYMKGAQEEVENSEKQPPSGSMGLSTLTPAREYLSNYVHLEDWYESPLRPGHYQLIVRKRFVWNGDWRESNPVTFDVIPRKPSALIPEGLKVRLVPQTTKPQVKGQPWRMGSDDYFDLEVVNDSDQPVKISVIDALYGNRLRLFKDGNLVPYVPEAAKLIQSKDSDPRLVELGDLVIPPKTTSQSQGLTLKNWYGALAPGLYRITNRRRFEIDGPWTPDSAELWFEVVKQQ
jgi:hypothetical protein